MHASSLENMRRCIDWYLGTDTIDVIDLGAMNVNGSYRDLFPAGTRYVGVDLEAGPGVDVVLEDAFKLPLKAASVPIQPRSDIARIGAAGTTKPAETRVAQPLLSAERSSAQGCRSRNAYPLPATIFRVGPHTKRRGARLSRGGCRWVFQQPSKHPMIFAYWWPKGRTWRVIGRTV